MKQRIIKTISAYFLIAFSIGLVEGCNQNLDKPVLAVFAFDVSCPRPELMQRYAKSVYTAQRSLPSGSQLRIYTFGSVLHLVYAGSKMSGRDAFNIKIGRYLLSPPPQLLAPGTKIDRIIERVADDVQASQLPCIAMVATDGGMEDRGVGTMKRLPAAILKLRGSSKLLVFGLIGTLPQFRTEWESWLEPLGNRASVQGNYDADTLLQAIKSREVTR